MTRSIVRVQPLNPKSSLAGVEMISQDHCLGMVGWTDGTLPGARIKDARRSESPEQVQIRDGRAVHDDG